MGLIDDEAVLETLGEAQRLGFLGAAPISLMIEHALQYVPALPVEVSSVVDVGAGGGLPGLVVALARPDLDVVLLDRRTRRTDFLSRAVRRLGLAERVRVLPGDAATLAHDVRWRGHFGAAIARGLGSPAITAELCRGFVGDGGC